MRREQRVEGAAGDAGAARGAAGARDRHAAVVGVGPPAAGAARARAAAGAARAAGGGDAGDRTHQQDRARLPRLDAPAGAGAPCRPRCARLLEEAVEIVQGVGAREPARVDAGRSTPHRRLRHRSGPAAPDPHQPAVPTRSTPSISTAASTSRRARCTDDDVLITVSDTGHGIPPDDLRAHLRAVLHDQGARQGHRPGPGHLPRAGGGAGRDDHGRERAGPGLDLLRSPAAPGSAGRRVAAARRGAAA